MVTSKYFEDIKNREELPWEWNKDDPRQQQWLEERKVHGFDNRETWDLRYTFICWLYPRLKMYNDVNIVDTTAYKIKYKNKEINFQESIDTMLNLCEQILSNKYKTLEEEYELNQNVLNLFSKTGSLLWW